MNTFADYVEKRKTRELAELCAQYNINLQPLVERLDRLCATGLPPEQIYREFMQQAANMVGNLAGRAVGGIGNMANSFGQGFQQGKGQQAGAGQNQQTNAAGQNQQQVAGQTQQGNQNIQMAVKQLQGLKGFVNQIGRDNQQIATDVNNSIQFIDRISQMIQQAMGGAH